MEYCIQFYAPHFKDNNKLEQIQKRAANYLALENAMLIYISIYLETKFCEE